MAKLTAQARHAIPAKDFAGPHRSYPIEDKSHARNALARASGKSVEAEVRAKVHAKYPEIGKVKESMDGRGDARHVALDPPSTKGLHARGHFSNHGKGSISHSEFHALDHGMKHDHMPSRTGESDGLGDGIKNEK